VQKVKPVNLGTKNSPDIEMIPVYEIEGFVGENEVKFDALDTEFSNQLKNYNEKRKGFVLQDGSVFLYSKLMKLKEQGIVDIFHGYVMSAHKVQGQTYNYSFVHEMNIGSYVYPDRQGNYILTPKSYAQIMYTGISRARSKVFVLTKYTSDETGVFKEPEFKNPMKSIATQENYLEVPSEFELENQCKL